MRNLGLVHRFQSVTKSGNDLWNGLTGSPTSRRIRRELTGDSKGSKSSGSNPKSVVMVDGESGFMARMTALRAERVLVST